MALSLHPDEPLRTLCSSPIWSQSRWAQHLIRQNKRRKTAGDSLLRTLDLRWLQWFEDVVNVLKAY